MTDSPTKNSSDPSQETHPEGIKGAGGPMTILFAPDMRVWHEARKLAGDKNLRVDDLATCASQDPSIVIEFLKTSNALYFSAGRQPITSTRTAIVRLGSEVILDMLEKMKDRPQLTDKAISHWFEIHRSRCKRTSLVARILAESIAKNLSDECQVIGLFLNVGEMLAVQYLDQRYVDLTTDQSRSGVNYRLAQDLKFDVEKMGLNYLRRNGIPEALLFAIDREGRSKSPERAIMKPLCLAAGELVEAFDVNRWDKFAPGKTIPPKSAIRTLPITEQQYLKLYERISEYLFAARVTEERQRQNAAKAESSPEAVSAPSDAQKLQSEISDILKETTQEVASLKSSDISQAKEVRESPSISAKDSPKTGEKEDIVEAFQLKQTIAKVVPRKQSINNSVAPPKMSSKKALKIVSSIADVMNESSNSEDLLAKILSMLVDNGPFKKSALIVVSKNRKLAMVVASRGLEMMGKGTQLNIEDPLNPLAQCFSKVQSFGNKESKVSPFGSNTFALAPIDADHETPVALYADCGKEGSISFEARRVFRTVVEILNEKLPLLPGGIPIEVDK